MPLYTITTQAGVLDSHSKIELADKLTAFHTEYAAVPKNWVHIVFHEYPIGSGFTAGRPSPTAALTLLIRTGRSPLHPPLTQ
jgi:phenylpyruvate tautomerase PptA (4-oxalocrotonate tautomerase family)